MGWAKRAADDKGSKNTKRKRSGDIDSIFASHQHPRGCTVAVAGLAGRQHAAGRAGVPSGTLVCAISAHRHCVGILFKSSYYLRGSAGNTVPSELAPHIATQCSR